MLTLFVELLMNIFGLIRRLTLFCIIAFVLGTISALADDRRVAEWVLLQGGSVRLAGMAGRVWEVTKLPDAEMQLELIDLVGTNISPPDLVRLEDLSHLKVLNLPGPMWNPRAGSRPNPDHRPPQPVQG